MSRHYYYCCCFKLHLAGILFLGLPLYLHLFLVSPDLSAALKFLCSCLRFLTLSLQCPCLPQSVSQFTSTSRACPGVLTRYPCLRVCFGPQSPGAAFPHPSRGCGCHIAACGALQAADSAPPRPRPGARGSTSVPSVPTTTTHTPRNPCISTILPCRPGSRDPNDLAPRTTSQAGTWRGSGHSGGGRPESRWRVSPSNTHPAPRPPREPAASPWPRKAVGAQSAATGDGPRRRLARARARQLLLGGRAPPLRLPPGAQPRGPESRHPCRAAGGSGCCVRARHRAHPGCGDPCLAPDVARAQAPGAGVRTAGSCALQRRPGREEGDGGGRREREGAG